jgi:hypothetical protein
MFLNIKDATLNSFTVAHLEYREKTKCLNETGIGNAHIDTSCYKLYLQVFKVSFYYKSYEIKWTCEIEDSKRQTPNRPQSSAPSHALMSHVVTSCERLICHPLGFETCCQRF